MHTDRPSHVTYTHVRPSHVTHTLHTAPKPRHPYMRAVHSCLNIPALAISEPRGPSLTVLAAHVDDECKRIADSDRASDPVTGGAVPVADLHVALGRTQREHHRVSRLGPEGEGVAGLVGWVLRGISRVTSNASEF